MVKKTDKTPPEMAAAAEKAQKVKAPAKPKPKPKADGRDLVISKRQVKVTNLNHSPEKAGKVLVEKVDVSLAMELSSADLDMVIETRRGELPSEELFDEEGNPAYPAMTSFPLELQAEGTAALMTTGAKAGNTFKNAVLKKAHVELIFGFKGLLTCQLRVTPGGHLDELGKLRIEEQALFSFTGQAVADEESDEQESLPL